MSSSSAGSLMKRETCVARREAHINAPPPQGRSLAYIGRKHCGTAGWRRASTRAHIRPGTRAAYLCVCPVRLEAPRDDLIRVVNVPPEHLWGASGAETVRAPQRHGAAARAAPDKSTQTQSNRIKCICAHARSSRASRCRPRWGTAPPGRAGEWARWGAPAVAQSRLGEARVRHLI